MHRMLLTYSHTAAQRAVRCGGTKSKYSYLCSYVLTASPERQKSRPPRLVYPIYSSQGAQGSMEIDQTRPCLPRPLACHLRCCFALLCSDCRVRPSLDAFGYPFDPSTTLCSILALPRKKKNFYPSRSRIQTRPRLDSPPIHALSVCGGYIYR